jgi:hypothetical protein
VVAVGLCAFLFLNGANLGTPRVRNFDTTPPFSYCYELQPDHRWEGVANAHTAADLRARP